MLASRAVRSARTVISNTNTVSLLESIPNYSAGKRIPSKSIFNPSKYLKIAVFGFLLSIVVSSNRIECQQHTLDCSNKTRDAALITSHPNAFDPVANLADAILRRAEYAGTMKQPINFNSIDPHIHPDLCPYQTAAFGLAYDHLLVQPSYSKKDFVRVSIAVNEAAEFEMKNYAKIDLQDLVREHFLSPASTGPMLRIDLVISEQSSADFDSDLSEQSLNLLALIREHVTSHISQKPNTLTGEIEKMRNLRSACIKSMNEKHTSACHREMIWGVRFANEVLAALKYPEIVTEMDQADLCSPVDKYLKNLEFLKKKK